MPVVVTIEGLPQYNRVARTFSRRVRKSLRSILYRMASDTLNGCFDSTPVLTGRARLSWRISKNKANARDVGKVGASLTKRPRVTFTEAAIKETDTLYISNGVRYGNIIGLPFIAKAVIEDIARQYSSRARVRRRNR